MFLIRHYIAGNAAGSNNNVYIQEQQIRDVGAKIRFLQGEKSTDLKILQETELSRLTNDCNEKKKVLKTICDEVDICNVSVSFFDRWNFVYSLRLRMSVGPFPEDGLIFLQEAYTSMHVRIVILSLFLF